MKKQALVIVLLFLFAYAAYPQVKIADISGEPDGSAMLEVSSTSKGLLIPRVLITDVDSDMNPVENPATGLLVFNTGSTEVEAGFFVWTGDKWAQMMDSESTMIQSFSQTDAHLAEIYEDNTGSSTTEILLTNAGTYYGWTTAGEGMVLGSMSTSLADPTADKIVIGEDGVYRVSLTISHRVGEGFVGAGEEVMGTVFHTPIGGSATETHVRFRSHVWLHEVFFPSAVGAAQGFLTLNAGDALDLRFRSDADDSAIEIFVISLTAERITDIPAAP